MSIRTEKVASVVKRALTTHISRIASENKLGLISITLVNLSKDLSIANVFLSILVTNSNNNADKINEALNIINQHKGMLRTLIAKELKIRSVPELRFFYDDTLEQMQNVDNLIDKMKREAPYKDDYGDENVYKNTKK
jgi:ribosome-binding factor A